MGVGRLQLISGLPRFGTPFLFACLRSALQFYARYHGEFAPRLAALPIQLISKYADMFVAHEFAHTRTRLATAIPQ